VAGPSGSRHRRHETVPHTGGAGLLHETTTTPPDEVKNPKKGTTGKTRPPPPPPTKGATVSLAKVLSRVDALDKRYHAAGEKAPLPLVALTTKRTDALHANPDELKEIWAWLDRWERSYLPER